MRQHITTLALDDCAICGAEDGLVYDVLNEDRTLRGPLSMCPTCRAAIGAGRFELTEAEPA